MSTENGLPPDIKQMLREHSISGGHTVTDLPNFKSANKFTRSNRYVKKDYEGKKYSKSKGRAKILFSR